MGRDVLFKLIGVSYEEMNCWDLAKIFYRDAFGVELKHYYEDPDNRLATQNLIYTNKSEFLKVDTPSYGDIVTMKVKGIESHIGIYIGDGLMIHTTKATGSVIDRTERWVKTIVGYYRPRGSHQ